MRLPRALCWLFAATSLSAASLAEVVIEGRVALPKARSAPVVNRRYEIVTKGGVMSTHPPLAVVYLEGAFASPVSPPIKQMLQKDLTFIPALLPVQVGTRVEFPNLDDDLRLARSDEEWTEFEVRFQLANQSADTACEAA